jgi:hypothetical protein
MPGEVVPAANTAVIVNHMELNGYMIISRLSGVASHLPFETSRLFCLLED